MLRPQLPGLILVNASLLSMITADEENPLMYDALSMSRSLTDDRFVTVAEQWIWTCAKRLAELHHGDPMSLEDWEHIAIALHGTESHVSGPDSAAQAYTQMPVSALALGLAADD